MDPTFALQHRFQPKKASSLHSGLYVSVENPHVFPLLISPKVRSGSASSPPLTPVDWSTVVITQREHGFTRSAGTPVLIRTLCRFRTSTPSFFSHPGERGARRASSSVTSPPEVAAFAVRTIAAAAGPMSKSSRSGMRVLVSLYTLGVVTTDLTPPNTTAPHPSSANGSHPSTVTLGRNLFIGTGTASFSFKPRRLASEISKTG